MCVRLRCIYVYVRRGLKRTSDSEEPELQVCELPSVGAGNGSCPLEEQQLLL